MYSVSFQTQKKGSYQFPIWNPPNERNALFLIFFKKKKF